MKCFSDPSWLQACSSLVQLAAAIVLVCVTWWYVRLTGRLVQIQSDPSVTLDVDQADCQIVLANEGSQLIVDVTIGLDTLVLRGAEGGPIARTSTGHAAPGKPPSDWLRLPDIKPGAIERRELRDTGQEALDFVGMLEGFREKGSLRGIPAADRTQLHAVLVFRLRYRREIDRKPYTLTRRALVSKASNTGDIILWGDDSLTGLPFIGDLFKRAE